MTEIDQVPSYCTNCGRQLESDWRVCPNCATPIGDEEYVAPPSSVAAPEVPGFGRAIVICFRKYVDFRGRASRSEFWFWFLFCWLIVVATTAVIANASYMTKRVDFLLGLFLPRFVLTPASLALILPTFAVVVRRLHDTNRSGAWVATFVVIWILLRVLCVPFMFLGLFADNPSPEQERIFMTPLYALVTCNAILTIIALFILALPGTPGENRYGPAPQKRAATLLREPERNLE